jgi:ABC-type methionine transport system ATPase subunit
VLCDEVTASIDYQTDKLVQETLRSSPALRDATVLTVAHRLRTIADSDLVVVLDAGRLVEVRICCSCICHQLSSSVVVCRRLLRINVYTIQDLNLNIKFRANQVIFYPHHSLILA